MKQHRVLLLTTYPITNPQHGGQKRSYAIYEAYKSQGASVKHSAIFFKGFYSSYGPDDIGLGPQSEALVAQSPLTGDIVSGEAIYNDPKVKSKMSLLLSTFKPTIIHLEQPFTYLGLKPLLEEMKLHPKLVFGSQNIEAPMKTEILESVNAPKEMIVATERQIHELEEELTRASDLVVACTPDDLEVHKKMGAKRLALAPNGIAEIETTQRERQFWKDTFKKHKVTRKVLFVGSAHPPNWTGFLFMVGKGLGFIPANTRIVLAGSICDYFDREISADNLDIADATFWLRAMSAGRLSEPRLGALIQESDIILLPITEGGGSNLKTAEAILANKKVIATTHALRSFEWFADFPNVWVADTPAKFRAAIVDALDAPVVERTAAQQQQAERVKWQSRLAEMMKEVKAL